MLRELLALWATLFPPCVVSTMRGALGLAYGNPRFKEITEPYWTRGYGTTCAVVLTWALMKCKWPGPLNRGPGWIVGAHMAPILKYAESVGAVERDPPLTSLKIGDIIYLEGSTAADWHVGIVESNDYPRAIVTLDGGQSDSRGEQSIARVVRTIDDRNRLGPNNFRRVVMLIRTRKVLGR